MAGAAFRLAVVLACMVAAVPAAARRPAPPAGTLTLDMADPVIPVTIAGVRLRLRVELDQHDVIELNDDVPARLGLPFGPGPTDDVGRVAAPSRVAAGTVTIEGRTVVATLSTHGTCCAGVDGAIGPAQLPYATVRLVRAGAGGGEARAFAMRRDATHGFEVRQPVGRDEVRLHFSLTRAGTLATASAGAMLAEAQGGRIMGGTVPAEVAFGIARPSRVIALARPIALAGFRFDSIATRTADFGGGRVLPQEATAPGEIVVRRRVRRQREWAAIVIGRDRLARCGEIRFSPPTAVLTLTCDFAA